MLFTMNLVLMETKVFKLKNKIFSEFIHSLHLTFHILKKKSVL